MLAGERIHLALEPANQKYKDQLDSGKFEYAPTRCRFMGNDGNGNYNSYYADLFDFNKNNCKNDFINFDIVKVGDQWRFGHLLFTWGLDVAGMYDYSLVCDIKLCDKDDADSLCNQVESNCL